MDARRDVPFREGQRLDQTDWIPTTHLDAPDADGGERDALYDLFFEDGGGADILYISEIVLDPAHEGARSTSPSCAGYAIRSRKDAPSSSSRAPLSAIQRDSARFSAIQDRAESFAGAGGETP